MPKRYLRRDREASAYVVPAEDGEEEKLLEFAPGDFADEFRAWTKAKKVVENGWHVHLYKFKDPLNSKRKTQVWEWIDHIPSAHDVGIEYGGGKYQLFCQSNSLRLVKCFDFELDEEAYSAARQKANPGTPARSNDQGNAIDQGVAMLSRVMSDIVKPLIDTVGSRQASAPAPTEMATVMGAMMGAMTQAMQKAMMSNIDFMEKMGRKMISQSNEVQPEGESSMPIEPEETAGERILKMLLPWVDKIAPMVLGNKPGAEAVIGMVKELPEYQQLKQNQKMLAVVLKGLEKKLGKKDLDKFLVDVGLQRPAVPAQVQPASPPTA